MILQAGSSISSAGTCGDCGAPASGNFCSSCGADLRQSALGFLGLAAAPVRRSFPIVYMKLLRAPIRATVALAEDPSYRNYLSFALTGVAIYCLFIVPVVMNMLVPAGGAVHVSDSLLTLMKVLSQVGVYVGIVITFAFAYFVFRLLSAVKRPLHAYFKLSCLALGFTAPINGAYEFIVSKVLHGTGLTTVSGAISGLVAELFTTLRFNTDLALQILLTPTALNSLVVLAGMFAYYIGIHRRFWQMPVWQTTPLYLATSWVSNAIGYYLMWYVGFYVARVLMAAGIVTN